VSDLRAALEKANYDASFLPQCGVDQGSPDSRPCIEIAGAVASAYLDPETGGLWVVVNTEDAVAPFPTGGNVVAFTVNNGTTHHVYAEGTT
jgi:hypothetical protein